MGRCESFGVQPLVGLHESSIAHGQMPAIQQIMSVTVALLHRACSSVFNRAGIGTDSIIQDQKVVTVLPGSSSDIAGLKVGDVILQVDGRIPSSDPLEQNDPAFLQPAGTVVRLKVKRDKVVRNFKVQLRDML